MHLLCRLVNRPPVAVAHKDIQQRQRHRDDLRMLADTAYFSGAGLRVLRRHRHRKLQPVIHLQPLVDQIIVKRRTQHDGFIGTRQRAAQRAGLQAVQYRVLDAILHQQILHQKLRIRTGDATARWARIFAVHRAVGMQILERARLRAHHRALAHKALLPRFGHIGEHTFDAILDVRMHITIDDFQRIVLSAHRRFFGHIHGDYPGWSCFTFNDLLIIPMVAQYRASR